MLRRFHRNCRTCTNAPTASPKSRCRTSSFFNQRKSARAASTKTSARASKSTSTRRAKNTIAASTQSRIIPSITSITGWSKFSPEETATRSASIRTRRPSCIAKYVRAKIACALYLRYGIRVFVCARRPCGSALHEPASEGRQEEGSRRRCFRFERRATQKPRTTLPWAEAQERDAVLHETERHREPE